MYGLYLARETFPNSICYYSSDAHYSVVKILHLFNMKGVMVGSYSNGEMDYQDLRKSLGLHRDTPAIIFATSGTTMKEATDDILGIKSILQELSMTDYYIHVDAAMCGFINPFLDPRPSFDFGDGADSVSMSGYKFLGCPIPCGVVIAKKDKVDKVGNSVEYIGNSDATIFGSRNGFTPIMLWYALKKLGRKGLTERAVRCLSVAEYAEQQLKGRPKHNVTISKGRPSLEGVDYTVISQK